MYVFESLVMTDELQDDFRFTENCSVPDVFVEIFFYSLEIASFLTTIWLEFKGILCMFY